MSGKHRPVDLVGAVVIGAALIMPAIATSGPNERSLSTFDACLVDEGGSTAYVCASKELSNVVVYCSNGFFKYDDLDEAPTYDGEFSCPDGGELTGILVKAGSARYDGEPLADLPAGSGLMMTDLAVCEAAPECPTPSADDEELEEEEEEEEEEEIIG